MSLSLQERAQARAHTFAVLARVYLHGVTADVLPYLEGIDPLRPHLPDSHDRDESAADHYHVFNYSVLPYESLFRDPRGLLGGLYSSQIAHVYRRAGFAASGEPDHIGQELAYLGHLCLLESQKRLDSDSDAAAQLLSWQREFLVKHMLGWLSPLAAALEYSDNVFYAALAELTLGLLQDHLLDAAWEGHEDPLPLPEPPDILVRDDTSLARVARFVLSPVFSGLFLSRDGINRLARKQQLPRGFGDRQQLLTNLLRSAGQYDRAGSLLTDLTETVQRWMLAYQRQLESYPALVPWIRIWQQRAGTTAVVLEQMRLLLDEPAGTVP